MKKILKYHPNIDMEPLFDWDADEDEQNLTALPHVVGWFDRAEEAVADDDENYNVKEKKLSAILQFAKGLDPIKTDTCLALEITNLPAILSPPLETC